MKNQTIEQVNHPKHYDVFPGLETIKIIASSQTVEEYRGFCFGNVLKYRLRVGKKDGIEQEIAKAEKYAHDLFETHKGLCRTTSLFE